MTEPLRPSPTTLWQRRAAAAAEVVALYIGGLIVARALGRSLGLGEVSKQQLGSLPPGTAPDFLALSWDLGLQLVLQYAVLLGLAFAIGRWHRSRPLPAYGVTRAGLSWRDHLLAGLTLYALGALPTKLLLALSHFVPLGSGPDLWRILEGPWTASFWVFMAVMSFGLVPFVEEAFARGYLQTRLGEDFGPASAVLLTAFIFVFSHTQYFKATPLCLGMLASLLVLALFLGLARHLTGSLIPGILAHALVNIPVRGPAEWIVLGLVVLILLVRHRQAGRWLRELGRIFRTVESWPAVALALLLFALILAAALFAFPVLLILVAIAAVAAATLEWREKLDARASASPPLPLEGEL